jgi:AcrR family transcriptional regulator
MPKQERPRRYTSRLREQQAAATRERIVRAAAELFAANGYAATSMPQIARAAEVSTETVQAHGPKIRLLHATIDALSFAAGDEGHILESERGAEFRAAHTPEEAAQISARILTAVNHNTHGLWLALSEAARSDENLAASFRTLTERMRSENLAVTRFWRKRGWLRPDVSDEELTRWSGVIVSVEVYDRVVRIEGATEDEYRTLIARLLFELMVAR